MERALRGTRIGAARWRAGRSSGTGGGGKASDRSGADGEPPPPDLRYFWEITDRVDHLPLEIVECPDDAALAHARDRLESMHVSLGSSPPFALTLAHHPGGDSLIMNLHHAAGDGMSSYRLMTSIARAYAGAEDPVPDVNPLGVRDLRGHIGARSVKDGIVRARLLRDRVSEARSEGPAARIAIEGGVHGAKGFHFHLLRLGPDLTPRS